MNTLARLFFLAALFPASVCWITSVLTKPTENSIGNFFTVHVSNGQVIFNALDLGWTGANLSLRVLIEVHDKNWRLARKQKMSTGFWMAAQISSHVAWFEKSVRRTSAFSVEEKQAT